MNEIVFLYSTKPIICLMILETWKKIMILRFVFILFHNLIFYLELDIPI